MSLKILSPRSIYDAYNRIKNYVNYTPVVRSQELDLLTGHRIHFKLENQQKMGAFKTRGVMNVLLKLKEQANPPKEIVAFSTGNHGKAISHLCAEFGFKATIVMPENVPLSKQRAAENENTKIIITKTRQETEDLVAEIAAGGAYLIPPSDHDMVISGNGTACYEALKEVYNPDAVFVPCGGGGLAAGSYLATKLFSDNIKLFAAEPAVANDAHISFDRGEIFRFKDAPNTIADGARTLGVSPRTFHYLKQIDGFYDVTEKEIVKCMIDINKMLGIICEPTSALALGACYKWLEGQKSRKEVVVIITGGNIDPQDYDQITCPDQGIDDLNMKKVLY
ncbi:L-threonine dehydratase catabolic TdcB [Candidatus Arcanobacter lacustris]|jgi:threonine dehydratase|uniref:L-threonine dehydratase catabolic TdcB n=1 Tax=Candidatus Arcanibacter lacustris TaxID=1607817 RepID=A0A0F5MN20_9RICK|nr:L-threonine dehydratase catabolic TdcB [Candidatus Arcanobacter lacustris]